MPAKSDPRDTPPPAPPEYFYRRSLSARELMPAIGAGVVVGAVVCYVAWLYSQRTPLSPEGTLPPRTRKRIGRALGN